MQGLITEINSFVCNVSKEALKAFVGDKTLLRKSPSLFSKMGG
ncbi:hypothetical protein QY97_03300 [Bacillus thermotolerans]|nr:hypothetical protein QY97_03300 [Bacillus thermotolerans]KKB42159.1 hypothetical protein QY96_01536 [Bacillus thermotolerans]